MIVETEFIELSRRFLMEGAAIVQSGTQFYEIIRHRESDFFRSRLQHLTGFSPTLKIDKSLNKIQRTDLACLQSTDDTRVCVFYMVFACLLKENEKEKAHRQSESNNLTFIVPTELES